MTALVKEGDVVAERYQIDRKIGAGAMGVVFAARHLKLSQVVAIKFMVEPSIEGAEAVARFLREARAVASLRSEHVARVSDVDTLPNGMPYLVMEFLEGRDLAQVLEAEGRLSARMAATYVHQACDALAEAHAANIIHRDLKPANLFVTTRRNGSPLVKVLDFGISKARTFSDPRVSTTDPVRVLGSPGYMSPEQIRSARNVDGRSDVWSLGVVLFELVTGSLPFASQTLADLVQQVIDAAPPSPQMLRPDLPEAFTRIVLRCLQKDPAARFASATELADALAAFLDSPSANVLSLSDTDIGLPAALATTMPVPIVLPQASPPAWESTRRMSFDAATTVPDAAPPAPAPRRARTTPAYLVLGGLAVIGCLLGAARVLAPPKPVLATVAPVPSPEPTEPAAAPAVIASAPLAPTPAAAPPPTTVSASIPRTTPPKPAPVGPAAPKPKPALESKPDCREAFYFDARGNKVFKPECL